MKSSGASRIAILWAGIVLGGSLLAAPAKFQVEDLTLPVALQVGRVQFLWVAIAEAACMAVAMVLFFITCRQSGKVVNTLTWWLLSMAGVLFLVQHLALMPHLQERSERIIAGEDVGESQLHVGYVILEAAKFMVLLSAGFWTGKHTTVDSDTRT